MPGVTEQEIAQAKQMNLYQYMQLCEPDNFKPEGPGQFRHKGHSSLTFAEDGSWKRPHPLPRRNRQRNSGCRSQIRTTTLLLPIFASAAFTPMC